MSTLRTLKKLLLGETWLLPVGLAAVLLTCALVIRPLAPHAWQQIGGLVLLAGVVVVLLASVGSAVARP
jgi:hypothetical protein